MYNKQLILLTILDGFGIAKNSLGNAITQTNMKNFEYFKQKYPWTKLHASGKWVGLPSKQMGNSEVGHLHLGAGRIKYESLLLINNAIKNNSFNENKEFLKIIENSKKYNSAFHIIGLFSDGGVHSHISHIFAIYKLAIIKGLTEIYLHIFGDGRDTKAKCIKKYISQFNKLKTKIKFGEIATIIGRYYAMDRDNNYNRIQMAYNMLVFRIGIKFSDAISFINNEYNNNRSDEFLMPGININTPNGYIKENDSIVFINFRADRMISMVSAFTRNTFLKKNYFNNFGPKIINIYIVTMTKYSDIFISVNIAFKTINIDNSLGEWLSKKQYRQLRIAETEKIAHVTFFFDGGRDYFQNGVAKQQDIILPGASCVLIPSPKVKTYDLLPEMSAIPITDKVIEKIKENKFDVIILNFANCDMVGHTGILKATMKAVKIIDNCLGKIYKIVKKYNGIMIITADHGNAEIMIDKDGKINKKHTSKLVPFIITKKNIKLYNKNVSLANVAPTILDLMNEEKPIEMTQYSLIKK